MTIPAESRCLLIFFSGIVIVVVGVCVYELPAIEFCLFDKF